MQSVVKDLNHGLHRVHGCCAAARTSEHAKHNPFRSVHSVHSVVKDLNHGLHRVHGNLHNGTTGTAIEGSTQNPANVGMTTVTYNLDLTASPSGYDIREIRLFSG